MRQMSTTTPIYRISEAAGLLGVSDDTVRRWVERGRLRSRAGPEGHRIVDGADLAGFAAELHQARSGGDGVSGRNRLTGLVTRVRRDGVMAQVELVCGSHQLTSLMTCELADELGLNPGVVAVATVTATNVALEILS